MTFDISTFPVDTGCQRAKRHGYLGKCINCIMEQCFEDMETEQLMNYETKSRNKQILNCWLSGDTSKELSKKFGLARRTIYRILEVKNPLNNPPNRNEGTYC